MRIQKMKRRTRGDTFSPYKIEKLLDTAIEACSDFKYCCDDLDPQTDEEYTERIEELLNIRGLVTILCLFYGYEHVTFKLTTKINKTDKIDVQDIIGKTSFLSDYWKKRIAVHESKDLSAIIYIIL